MTACPRSFDVVVVGLGPTGLVLAHTLGRLGIPTLVLEREPRFYGNARAVYTDGECLRIFQALGMADRLQADMIEDVPIQLMLGDRSVLGTLTNGERPYGWALSNFFYQPLLETVLADGLAAYPHVQVLRGREVRRVEQDAQGVTVWHRASQGAGYGKPADPAWADEAGELGVRARYLVGADGGRSTVRTLLNIGMQGRSFPNPWLVVDIKAKDGLQGLRHLPYFSFVCDPDCPTVNCVQPQGHHRFEFMLAPDETKEHMEHPETVRRHLSKWVDVDKFVVLRRLVYTFNALVADRWRDGRVLLAGDAAHMTPQFVGQGMNSGVRDGFNLGWKLAAILRGQAGECLLDTYERERRPHVEAMIREAVRLKDFVSVSSHGWARVRNALTRLVLATPGLGEYIRQGRHMPQPVFRQAGYLGLPRRGRRGLAGRLMVQPQVRGDDGRLHRLDDLLGLRFVLIGAGVDPLGQLSPQAREACRDLGIGFAVVYPWGGRPSGRTTDVWAADLIEIEDVCGAWLKALRAAGHRGRCVVLVRPDKFVFGVAPAAEADALVQALRDQLRCPGAARPQVQPAAATPAAHPPHAMEAV